MRAISIYASCSFFAHANLVPDADGQPKFAIFDIVFGTIYAVACAIEVFGVIAATTVRPHLLFSVFELPLRFSSSTIATTAPHSNVRYTLNRRLGRGSRCWIHARRDTLRIQGTFHLFVPEDKSSILPIGWSSRRMPESRARRWS